MDVERVARYVKRNPADAWVVSAASREVLEWFASQPTPAIAMYGRSAAAPIAAACTIMIPSMTEAVRRLVELGHKRIVMIAREERRKPRLSRLEQAFIDELEAAGIKTGDYNLPDWEESPEWVGTATRRTFPDQPAHGADLPGGPSLHRRALPPRGQGHRRPPGCLAGGGGR